MNESLKPSLPEMVKPETVAAINIVLDLKLSNPSLIKILPNQITFDFEIEDVDQDLHKENTRIDTIIFEKGRYISFHESFLDGSYFNYNYFLTSDKLFSIFKQEAIEKNKCIEKNEIKQFSKNKDDLLNLKNGFIAPPILFIDYSHYEVSEVNAQRK